MSTVILKGAEAIHFAETHGLPLHRYADDVAPARDDLTITEGRRIAAGHPELIWVESHIGVNSGEPPQH